MRQSTAYFSNVLLLIKTLISFAIHSLHKILQSAFVLSVIALILLCLEFSTPSAFSFIFDHTYNPQKITNLAFFISYTVICFLLLPIIINKFLYKEKLSNLGLISPKNKLLAATLTFLAILIFVPIMVLLAKQESFRAYYSINNPDLGRLTFLQLVIFPMYYYCEEFFFRGFLLLNLWKKVKWHSLWITDIIFIFAHISKPLAEIMMALPVGIVFAFLTLTTRSIYPSIIVHYCMGIAVILTVNHFV